MTNIGEQAKLAERVKTLCDQKRADIREAAKDPKISKRQKLFNEGAFTAYSDVLATIIAAQASSEPPTPPRLTPEQRREIVFCADTLSDKTLDRNERIKVLLDYVEDWAAQPGLGATEQAAEQRMRSTLRYNEGYANGFAAARAELEGHSTDEPKEKT